MIVFYLKAAAPVLEVGCFCKGLWLTLSHTRDLYLPNFGKTFNIKVILVLNVAAILGTHTNNAVSYLCHYLQIK